MGTRHFDIGKIHFTGIGGIGMSGIAEVMVNLGYVVQGSDLSENANITRLRAAGVVVTIGHHEANIDGCGVVVMSSAVSYDNPEIQAARKRAIPVVGRAEMLAELMRFRNCVTVGGTHGKTTTTSLIAAIFEAGALNPTVINGGIINTYRSNAKLGEGKWMVVEADESDGSFIRLPALMAVVTNIDNEHTEYYGDVEKLHEAFRLFVQNTPFYGLGILCIDHPVVQRLVSEISDRRIITYGLSPQAMIRASNVCIEEDPIRFDVELSRMETLFPDRSYQDKIDDVVLPMVGVHNVKNALAAIAAGLGAGIDVSAIRQGLTDFNGVKRRFSLMGEVAGITIIDDYAHHPVEIEAVISAALSRCRGRLIVVMQPHRYSRLRALFDDFCSSLTGAHYAFIADVYAAGEAPEENFSGEILAQELQRRGHTGAEFLSQPAKLAGRIAAIAEKEDMVLFMGAGSITQWANDLPRALHAELTRLGKEEI